MASGDFLASLNLGTLVIILVIAAAALFFFLRRRSNRHPMEGKEERNVGRDIDIGREPPDNSPPR